MYLVLGKFQWNRETNVKDRREIRQEREGRVRERERE